MKKIVLVMIVALMGIAMNAQQPRHHKDHGSPEQMVERRVEKLAKVLELTEAQKAEVSKIYSQEMETMKQEHRSMSPEGQQQARPDESARKARHEQMRPVVPRPMPRLKRCSLPNRQPNSSRY